MYDYLPRDLATLFAEAYIGESTPNGSLNPGVSPVFADLESLRGLPPLLIEAGGSEVLLRQIQRLAERVEAAGVDVRLTVARDMVHVFQVNVYTEDVICLLLKLNMFVYTEDGSCVRRLRVNMFFLD